MYYICIVNSIALIKNWNTSKTILCRKTLIMACTVLGQSIDSGDYLMFSFGSSVQVR